MNKLFILCVITFVYSTDFYQYQKGHQYLEKKQVMSTIVTFIRKPLVSFLLFFKFNNYISDCKY